MRIAGIAIALASCLLLSAQSGRDPITHVSIEGVQFAYVDAGRGDPVILVHGGLQDYRLWSEHIPVLAKRHRVIAYSRRNHFPNSVSAEGVPDNAGDLHAKDLAALIGALGLTRPHLVGHSSGALTVLFFAATNPGVARTLVLNEPNAISLLADVPDGAVAMREFTERFAAAREAFRQRQIDRALPMWADAVSGPGSWARRSEADRRMNADNALANVADQITSRPRTPFTCEMARRIATPTLLTTGERSPAFFHHIVGVLERCLPTRERLSIAGASHTVPAENPGAYRQAVLAFLGKN